MYGSLLLYHLISCTSGSLILVISAIHFHNSFSLRSHPLYLYASQVRPCVIKLAVVYQTHVVRNFLGIPRRTRIERNVRGFRGWLSDWLSSPPNHLLKELSENVMLYLIVPKRLFRLEFVQNLPGYRNYKLVYSVLKVSRETILCNFPPSWRTQLERHLHTMPNPCFTNNKQMKCPRWWFARL